MIREEEPPRPSLRLSSSDALPSLAASRQTEPLKLTRMVRGDLDWIVMKCLEKDRARRYETAERPGPRHRALPARRAGRGLAAVAAVSPAEIRAQAPETDRHRRGICPARGGGSRREHLASHAGPQSRTPGDLPRATTRPSSSSRRNGRRRGRTPCSSSSRARCSRPPGPRVRKAGSAATRRSARRSTARSPRSPASFAGEPLVEASIRNTLGVSYWYLGDQEKALEQQERAVALRRQELGPEHPETVGAMNDLAIVLRPDGKVRRGAEDSSRRWWRSSGGPSGPKTRSRSGR